MDAMTYRDARDQAEEAMVDDVENMSINDLMDWVRQEKYDIFHDMTEMDFLETYRGHAKADPEILKILEGT